MRVRGAQRNDLGRGGARCDAQREADEVVARSGAQVCGSLEENAEDARRGVRIFVYEVEKEEEKRGGDFY